MNHPIKVLLVDDQTLFREGMRTLLAEFPDLTVVGDVGSGVLAMEFCRTHAVDVIVMDLYMPGWSGIETTRQILFEFKTIKILMLSSMGEEEALVECLQAGARGFLLKNCAAAQLMEAIVIVHGGETYLQPCIATKVVNVLSRTKSAWDQISKAQRRGIESLTFREIEILKLLSAGCPNKEIASKSNLTEGTVKNYMTTILIKLQVPDRISAALLAKDLGLV